METRKTKGVWRDMVSVFAGILMVILVAGCTALFFVLLKCSYEDYLINRQGLTFVCVFGAAVAIEFLTVLLLFHLFGDMEGHPVLSRESFWIMGAIFLNTLLSVDFYDINLAKIISVQDAFVAMTALFLTGLFAVLLSVCPLCLCRRYGKKGVWHFLFLLVYDVLWQEAYREDFSAQMGWKRLVVPILFGSAFLVGFLQHLFSERRKEAHFWGRRGTLLAGALFLLCFGFLAGTGKLDGVLHPAPRQDEEGYYQLCSAEGFQWFIDRANEMEDANINVRLMADIRFNDTSDWESWAECPPENEYRCIRYYNGHFDGNGHTLEGYYPKWERPIFGYLGEQAVVTDLTIRRSLFKRTYAGSRYEDDGKVDVNTAAALCFTNTGRIAGCDVEAQVSGAFSAGGIVSVNRGVIEDCRFAGRVEGGSELCEQEEGKEWVRGIYVGGICESNWGEIRDCLNEAELFCGTVNPAVVLDYYVGGITGYIDEEGSVESCSNEGDIESPQYCGGIAGSNWGEIRECRNTGKVHVEQEKMEYAKRLVTAGISACNRGLVESSVNTGDVTIHSGFLSMGWNNPVYGIAWNQSNPYGGRTRNCYYLSSCALQDYRQPGVYKLSESEMAEVERYVAAGSKAAAGGQDISDSYVISDVDSWELFAERPDFPGTDEADYIYLGVGPEGGLLYKVQPGDTLWGIAEKFYGDGSYYPLLGHSGRETIFPGERIAIHHLDRYLLRANGEVGFGERFNLTFSGKKIPTRFFMARPAGWYYGYYDREDFAAGDGLQVLRQKREVGQELARDMRIFCSIDENEEGDFLAADWEGAKEKIEASAEAYCGDGIEDLRFYRYGLENGESLYGYTFRLYPYRCPYESKGLEEALDCAVFYRMREGLIVEFIGVEPAVKDSAAAQGVSSSSASAQQDHAAAGSIFERTRYLAAAVANEGRMRGEVYDGEYFYGRENWAFTRLHNPFATVLEYDFRGECHEFRYRFP